MPYLQSPSPLEPAPTADYIHGVMSYNYPQPEPYHTGDYAGPTEISYNMSPTIQQNGRQSYASSGYDDYSEGPNPLEAVTTDSVHAPSSPEVPSIEQGNKLLSFQPYSSEYVLLDNVMRRASVLLSAQLHGMFFLAESSRAGSPELTCYRRNLFQITGSVTLPRTLQYIVSDRGDRTPIMSQELCISAVESIEGSPVKIISVPWKTPVVATAQPTEEKVEKEPTSIVLDQMSSHDGDSETTVIPIAWKRLQFRVATANNGRRKELQQHFTIKLSVVATLSTGSKVSICEAQSVPIVVRGRSPRNFSARRDLPLPGSGSSTRRNLHSPTLRKSPPSTSPKGYPKPEFDPQFTFSTSHTSNSFRANGTPPTSGGYMEWQHSASMGNGGLTATHSSTAPVSPYTEPSPEITNLRKGSLKRKPSQIMPGHSPHSVSSDRSLSRAPSDGSRKMSRPRQATIPMTNPPYYPAHHSPSLPFNIFSSGQHYSSDSIPRSDAANYMPDYFPVAMDCYSAPMEYRPHILQSTTLPPSTGVGWGVTAMDSRRYLSEDVA